MPWGGVGSSVSRKVGGDEGSCFHWVCYVLCQVSVTCLLLCLRWRDRPQFRGTRLRHWGYTGNPPALDKESERIRQSPEQSRCEHPNFKRRLGAIRASDGVGGKRAPSSAPNPRRLPIQQREVEPSIQSVNVESQRTAAGTRGPRTRGDDDSLVMRFGSGDERQASPALFTTRSRSSLDWEHPAGTAHRSGRRSRSPTPRRSGLCSNYDRDAHDPDRDR